MNEEVFMKLLKGLNNLTGELIAELEGHPEAEEEVAPKAKGKKKAGKKVEPVESDDDDADSDDMGFGSDDDSDDDVTDTTTMDDVREAFQAFVAKHKDTAAGRLAASKILAKFKVKKITELEEDDFAKAIAETKKKK